MPKRNEQKAKAKNMYQKGMRLVEIAKALNIPEGTVRRWKHSGWGDGKNERSLSGKKTNEKTNVLTTTNTVDNRGSSQRGEKGKEPTNENPKTPHFPHQARPNNKNAIKTGRFADFYFSDATADELAMLDAMKVTGEIERLEALVYKQIMHEKRMSDFAKAIRDNPSMTLVEIEKRIFTANKHGSISQKVRESKADMLEVDTVAKIKRLIEVENAIIYIQNSRVRNEEKLHRMRILAEQQQKDDNVVIKLIR
ncbi:MAG: helix-turn-helix domain-containing protein [Defluviitaleaceae bacterium]|nr:helix-turn-helix domain-containing protein [Defluviitaleaceae bacterium]